MRSAEPVTVASGSDTAPNKHLPETYFDDLPGDFPEGDARVRIERARACDVAGIVRAYVLGSREAFRHLDRDEHVRTLLLRSLGPRRVVGCARAIASGEAIYVARTSRGAVVGYINHEPPDNGTAYIAAVYVLPGWHGRGIGQRLMNRVLNELSNMCVTRVWLYTTEGSTGQQWYEQKMRFVSGGLDDVPEPLAQAGIPAYQRVLSLSI
ncbi:N-acetyltransferase [Nocardia panacis]|uniref:N-acetyltransferase n=1 Tax=Nocardia panacis TaxID=2340916 RepID=A0A3A4KCT4_9NOCA|nr:GNAT family N-acetyltransferase [Nocardia panacis]RJO79878.1 N-acetyltransferase [Nocardia panacis]